MREKSKKIIVLLLLGLVVHQHLVISQLEMLSGGMEALGAFNSIHDTFLKFSTPSTQDVLDKTIELAESLEKMEETLGMIQSSIDNLMDRLPLLGKIANDVQLLNSHITRIDMLYDELLYYLENPNYFIEDSHSELFKTFTSYGHNDVAGTITQINGLIVPRRLGAHKESLFLLLAKEIQGEDLEACGIDGALHQRLRALFNLLADAEVKASILMGFGYTMQEYMDNRNTTGLLKRAEEQLAARSEQYFDVLKKSLAYVPAFYRRCDPPEGYERGVTFHEFERFLTAFLVQESGVGDHVCTKSCDRKSQPTTVDTGYGCKGFECSGSSTTCYGHIFECENMPGGTTVCEYNPLQSRRYSWFENQGVIYGHEKSDCSEGDFYYPASIPVADYACDLCRCICVEDGRWSWAHRFVSLREQVSDIEDNMVITGLQFVMVNKIASVRIMQGKVGPDAEIIENSTSWIEPEDIRFDLSSARFIKKSEDESEEKLKNDEDVATFSLPRRRFNLDSLALPEKYVVTGIRFRRNKKQDNWPVQLEIRGTLLDLETFQLQTDSTTWIAPDDNKKREAYVGEGFDNPMRSTKTSVDSKPYTFIDLDWTSFQGDGAQTTIPLLDGLPVYGRPLVPLIRVNLSHKKQPGYGGFLTFVLEGFNRAPYLTLDPEKDLVLEEN